MKKLTIILLSFFATALMAQNPDVTVYSQNIALVDSLNIRQDISRQLAPYPSISESYEIPAYSLYQKYWDTANLRSKMLEIPFSNDRLMLMLVQDANTPFVMPCQFDKIRTTYGETKNGAFHPGIDLKTEPQTLVKSCFDGVVRMANNYGDYGTTVVVRHYNGLETVYAHLDKVCVKPNQIVKAGQVIGQTGTSGNTKECGERIRYVRHRKEQADRGFPLQGSGHREDRCSLSGRFRHSRKLHAHRNVHRRQIPCRRHQVK